MNGVGLYFLLSILVPMGGLQLGCWATSKIVGDSLEDTMGLMTNSRDVDTS